ncbi:hypothetical protein CEXT_23461 [Caerostris extrusa]|uniref:Uncharacterized protein n=1 Tax=Caerostris extrusa TaxID=172846 RepID=A0AAV4PA74_CAEEX|nr:hypothetical protein CEXT_23461 [Caerostris extrusa]
MSLMQVSPLSHLHNRGQAHPLHLECEGSGGPSIRGRLYQPPDQVKCGAELANLGLSPPRQNMLLRQHSELRGRDFAAGVGFGWVGGYELRGGGWRLFFFYYFWGEERNGMLYHQKDYFRLRYPQNFKNTACDIKFG